MASTAALELLVSLQDGASKGLDDIGEKGGGMGDAIKSGAAIAGGAILGLGAILVGATKAAADDEAERARLNNTLKNAIPNWDGNATAIDKLISAGQKLAFTDSEVRDSLGFLVGQTGDLTEAQALQATAMDLARAKGIDLSVATKAVGKVDAESMGILKKYGIIVDEHATKEEALAAIRAQTAGQAETFANSTAGAMTRIQDSLGEAFESLGGAILPLVSGPLAALADWFQSPEVQAGIQAIATFVGQGLSQAFTTLQGIISAVWPIIEMISGVFTSFFANLQGGMEFMPALGNMFSNLGSVIQDVWGIVGPALGTLLGNIVQWIIDNGPTILAQLATWAAALWQWVVDAIPVVLTTLGNLITSIWQWIQDNGPAILAQLVVWANAFWQWIVDVMPVLLEQLSNLVSAIWTWIQDNAPGIFEKLASWAGAFWQWIVDVMPVVLDTLGNLLTSVWNWILENGPSILVQLGQWALAFIGWILPMIPPFLLELGKIALAILGWIVEMAGTLLDKLINEWVPALWNWITGEGGVLATIGPKLGEIAGAIWTWLTTTAGDFFDKLINEWVPQLWNWITGEGGVIATIGPKLGEIASAIWTWVTTTAGDLFDKLINEWVPQLWNWITGEGGVLSVIGTKLNEIWTAITGWISETATAIFEEVKTVGKNMADGIGAGFQSAWSAVQSNIINPLIGLPANLNAAQGAQSPATLFMPVGANAAQGIGAGFTGAWNGVTADMIASITAVGPQFFTAVTTLCDDDILAPIQRLCDEDVPAVMARLTNADGVIQAPLKRLTDADMLPIIQRLCDDDIVAPIRTLCDEDIPAIIPQVIAGLKTVGADIVGGLQQGMEGAYGGAMSSWMSFFDGLWGEASRRAQEIQDLMNFGTAGSGDPYAGGNPASGTGGGGGRVLGATMAGGGITPVVSSGSRGGWGGMGGGISIGSIIIHAGFGANGGAIADEVIEELEYRLGDQIAIRRGHR